MQKPRKEIKKKTNITRRQFIKTTAALGITASVGPFIIGATSQKLAKTLRVESWGGSYQDALRKAAYKPFEKKYGTKIIESSFATTDECLAKIKASPAGEYDVVDIDDVGIYKGIKQGLLEPLDLNIVTNYSKMLPKFQRPPYDPGPEIYGMPLEYYTTALVYNTEAVTKEPDSWELLWDKKYSKKLSLWDWPWCRIANTALYLGQDPNNISDIDAIFDAMTELNKLVLKYYSAGSEMQQLLTNRDVLAGEFWSGRTMTLAKQGVPVKFKIPKEGAYLNAGVCGIAKGCKKNFTAQKFIDFIGSPEVYPKVSEIIGYVPCLDPKYYKVSDILKQNPEFNPEIIAKCAIADNDYKEKHEKKWVERFNLMKAQ